MSAPSPTSPRAAVAATGLVLLGLAAYHNSFSVPFVFDDIPSIVENRSIHGGWDLTEVLLPDQAGGVTSSGRPLVNLSFALNYAVSGLAVWSYHAMNLLIHLAAGLCLLGFVRRTLMAPMLRERYGTAAGWLALAVAALWLLHPLQTESVTYVVQRAESMVGLFFLLTLYAGARGMEPGVGRRWLGLSIAACLAGMACKEVMVSAPVLVLLYDRTFWSESFGHALRRRRGFYAGLAATWIVLVALVAFTGGRGGTAGFAAGISVWAYLLTQCQAIVTYTGLAFWPHPLVFDYGLGTATNWTRVAPQALLLLAALAAGGWAVLRRSPWGFVGAFFFAVLAPSSSVVPVVTQTMAEHRLYLPLAALLAAAVLGAHAWAGRRLVWVVSPAALALVLLTVARNHDYRSETALWADTAAKYPTNARAHNNLGQALYRAGQIDAAVRSYERALALQPRYPETHYNLGVARAHRGDLAGAIASYETALGIQPDYPEALNNLGNALGKAGRVPEAIARYKEALARRPGFAAAHNNLGNALLQTGRPADAGREFEHALRLRPNDPETLYNLGNAWAAAGDMGAALREYERALRVNPRYAAAHVNAGNARLELKQPALALSHYDAALAADPALPDAHFNRGSVLLDQERWGEAVAAFESALRLNPAQLNAERALGFALAQLQRWAEAVPHYERYLAARPDDAGARDELERARAAAGGTLRRR